MKLSAVILTKNEENNIRNCLESLNFCDEILVIDDNSTDKTAEIARKLGVKVFSHPLNNDFAQQRNYGLKKATNDWVLFIDADEEVPEALASEINNLKFTINNGYLGFYIRRKDFWQGKEINYGETGSIKLLRLAKKDAGEWVRPVHEIWNIKTRFGTLQNPILHYPHPSLKEFITEINQYSTLHAKANYKEGKKSSLLKIIFWPKGKFIYNWIFRLGFLDGTAGFMIALMMSFHSFLAWGKLWILQRETR